MPSQVSYLLPRGTCLHFVAHRVPLPLFSFFYARWFPSFFCYLTLPRFPLVNFTQEKVYGPVKDVSRCLRDAVFLFSLFKWWLVVIVSEERFWCCRVCRGLVGVLWWACGGGLFAIFAGGAERSEADAGPLRKLRGAVCAQDLLQVSAGCPPRSDPVMTCHARS